MFAARSCISWLAASAGRLRLTPSRAPLGVEAPASPSPRRSSALIRSHWRFTSPDVRTSASPKTCGWRRTIFAAIAALTSVRSKTPASAASWAWRTTCSRRSPNSSARAGVAPPARASAVSSPTVSPSMAPKRPTGWSAGYSRCRSAIGSAPWPWRPGRIGASSEEAAAGAAAGSMRSTAAGTIKAGRAGSRGDRTSDSAARTWRPSLRSRPQRSRASATSASSTGIGRLGRRVECGQEVAGDLHRVLLPVIPVLEAARLDRRELVLVRRGGLLLEHLEEVEAVVRDVHDLRQPVHGRRGDRVGQPVVQLALHDPADLATGSALRTLREVGDEVRERGTAGGLRLELGHLVAVQRAVHDLNDVPAVRALERREDLTRLEPVGEDLGREVGVKPASLAVLVEVRQLAAGAVVALCGGLVALLAGER